MFTAMFISIISTNFSVESFRFAAASLLKQESTAGVVLLILRNFS